MNNVKENKMKCAPFQTAEKFCKTLIETFPDAVAMIDLQSRFVYVSEQTARLLGVKSTKALIGENSLRFIALEDRERVSKNLKQAAKKGIKRGGMYHAVRKDGTCFVVEVSVSPLCDARGKTEDFVLVLRDVTERKKAEETLRQSGQRYRNLYELAPYAIVTVDRKGVITSCNAATLSYTGYSEDEIVGKHFSKLPFHRVSDIPKYIKIFNSLIRGKVPKPFEINYNTKDGTSRWVQGYFGLLGVDGSKEGFQIAFEDITERKQVEQDLRESEEKLSQIVQGSSVPTFVINNNHIITHWNKACENLTGISANEVIGTQKHRLAFYPAERPVMADVILNNIPEEELDTYYGSKYRKSRLIEAAYEAEDFFPHLGESGKWLFFTAAPLRDVEGNVIGAIETLHDITERKQVEEALRNKEAEWASLVKSMPAIVFTTDRDGKIMFMNRTVSGYTLQDSIGKTVYDFTPPAYHEIMRRSIRQTFETGDTIDFETVGAGPDGTTSWYVTRVGPIMRGYKINAAIMISSEITERKRTEEDLQHITEGAHAIIWRAKIIKLEDESQGCAGFSWDTHYLNLESVTKYLPLQKHPSNDLSQMFYFSVLEEDRAPMDLCSSNALKRGADNYTQEFRLIDANGALHWMYEDVQIKRLSDTQFECIGLITDITEHKQAEQEIRASEERFKTLTEDAPIGIYYNNFKGTFLYGNKKAEEIIGYKSEELIGKSFLKLKLLGPQYMIKAIKLLALNKKGKATGPDEFILNRKDGTQRLVEINTNVITIGDKRVVLGMVQDITERKQAEVKLRESEAHYRALAEASHDMVVVADHKGRLTYTNQYAAQQLESSPQELAGNKIAEIFPSEIAVHQSANLQKVFQSGEALYVEAPSILHDRVVWLGTWLSPIVDERGKTTHVLIVSRDITERKRAEEQIKKDLKEKEVLLRELYHRTKNNMQVICAMLRLQASRLEDQKIKELFKEIETKIYSMALVHQKLLGSRDLSYLNLKDYLDTLLIHFKQSYFESLKNISIHTDMEDINILIDTAIPLGLVFNELISNVVKHAFPDSTRGEIKIKLYLSPQNKIVLEVSDNGIGLPKGFKIQKDIHLGLEIVIDLIEYQLDGKIYFKSKDGLHCKIVLTKELYKPRV